METQALADMVLSALEMAITVMAVAGAVAFVVALVVWIVYAILAANGWLDDNEP